MNKSTLSILMAASLAASGLVVAQTPAVPADGTSPPTRAEVKSQIPQEGSAGDKRGQGPIVNVPTGGNSENTRAGVKSEIPGKGTTGVERGEGPVIDNKSTMTSAERKAKRDERKAMAKAKRDSAMKGGSKPSEKAR